MKLPDSRPFSSDLADRFRRAFGAQPEAMALAPGRVNLIGEHVDYCGGWVLPMAVDRGVGAALRRRQDRRLRLRSEDLDGWAEWDLEDLKPGERRGWADYPAGVYWALAQAGVRLAGADVLLMGDLPRGAGLSSSAALELAVARAALGAQGLPWDAVAMALAAQKAENGFVGVQCGIMDQMAVAAAEPACAMLLHCDSLRFENVPIDFRGCEFVVAESGVQRQLKSSAYNDRRRECEEGLSRLRSAQPGLANLSSAQLPDLQALGEPGAAWHRRARHVVSENARVHAAVAALRAGDAPAFGRLMGASHASLRDDFEVSCRELDALVDIALGLPGCLGSRLTGAGFGGCTVSLVESGRAEAFAAGLAREYKIRSGLEAVVHRFGPGRPAELL